MINGLFLFNLLFLSLLPLHAHLSTSYFDLFDYSVPPSGIRSPQSTLKKLYIHFIDSRPLLLMGPSVFFNQYPVTDLELRNEVLTHWKIFKSKREEEFFLYKTMYVHYDMWKL